MVTFLNEIGFLDGPKGIDMLCHYGTTYGFFDVVPVRLLATMQLFSGQVHLQYSTSKECREMLDDMAANKFKYKLRRTNSSATKDLRKPGLKNFIFHNSDLMKVIDYGVLYILDHAYFSCIEKMPPSGDHRLVYYQQMVDSSFTSVPAVHYKRLPTMGDVKANSRIERTQRFPTRPGKPGPSGSMPIENEDLLSEDDDEASCDGVVDKWNSAANNNDDNEDDEEDDDDRTRKQGDFSKSRRLRAIASIWKRKTVKNQFNIVTFLKEGNCGIFDTVHCFDTAHVVMSKLPNLLAIASLSDLAIGSRPLITPLSQCHLKERRYKHALYTFFYFSINTNTISLFRFAQVRWLQGGDEDLAKDVNACYLRTKWTNPVQTTKPPKVSPKKFIYT